MIPAYDIRNQCSGFLYGLEMACALVQNGTYRRILLVGAEVHSTGLDISTRGRDVSVLFGDGAGSCIVERGEEAQELGLSLEVLGTELHSDGAHVKELWCEHPGSARFPTRLTPEMVEQGEVFAQMNGRMVFENAVKRMSEVSASLMAAVGVAPSEIALFVPHQANRRISEAIGKHLGLSAEQVFNTIEEFGNTTAATIPIGMSCAVEQDRLHSGDFVLSAAFGSGFTWGAALFRVR
jgi:3-oxoacyl-[acyl-carrier-protein] synthase-3